MKNVTVDEIVKGVEDAKTILERHSDDVRVRHYGGMAFEMHVALLRGHDAVRANSYEQWYAGYMGRKDVNS